MRAGLYPEHDNTFSSAVDIIRTQSSALLASADSNVIPMYSRDVLENDTLGERLWDNKASLKIFASKYGAAHWDLGVKGKLFSQIDWLLDVDGWHEDDMLVSIESFRTLLKFILNVHVHKAPCLGLSDKGNILASFVSEQGKLILECRAEDCTDFWANCILEGRKVKVAGGAESTADLLDVLRPFEKFGWFSLDGQNN